LFEKNLRDQQEQEKKLKDKIKNLKLTGMPKSFLESAEKKDLEDIRDLMK